MSTSSGITRSKVCIKCGVDKLIDAFGHDKRTPDGRSKTCHECRFGGGKKRKGTPARQPKSEAAREPVAETDTPRLSIAPGLGVEAWLENGCLQLSQGEDVVALSPTEWKVVVAQFEEWAA